MMHKTDRVEYVYILQSSKFRRAFLASSLLEALRIISVAYIDNVDSFTVVECCGYVDVLDGKVVSIAKRRVPISVDLIEEGFHL